MKKLFLLLLIILTATTVSAGSFFYDFTLQDDCYQGANFTARVYDGTWTLVETTSSTSLSNGVVAFTSGAVADNTDYNINISITNSACSPSLNQSYDTTGNSGFGIPTTITDTVSLSTIFDSSTPTGTISNNQTQFIWTTDYIGYTYNLEVATDNGFASIIRDINAAGSSYTLLPIEELSDGTYYWRVHALNASPSIVDTSSTKTFTVAAGAAAITGSNPVNNSWVTNTQSIQFTTDKNAECHYSLSAGIAYGAKTNFTTTGATTHSSSITFPSEGTNNVYIECNTTTGVMSGQDAVYVFRRDTTPPTAGTVVINGGNATTQSTTLTVNWSGFADASSGLTGYYYSFSDNGGTTSGTYTTNTYATVTSGSQGTRTVYVWAVDSLGNIGLAASDSIIVDSLPPMFVSFSETPANLNKYHTGNFAVSFTISESTGIDNVGDIPQFRYRIGSDAWSTWSDVTSTGQVSTTWLYAFTISEGTSPNTWFERSGENLSYQVNATDTLGLNNMITRTQVISDAATPPVFNAVSNKIIDEDTALRFNFTGSDVDLDIITYTCNITGPSISRISDTTSQFSWTPTNDDVGTQTVLCNATDNVFTVSRTFTITVLNVNDAPVIEEITELYAQEYVYFNYTINASDADNDLLLYTSNMSSLFSLNKLSGKISFTPFSTQRGSYEVNVSVSDGAGGSDYEEFTFTVGYCGDNVCREEYEDCSICAVDCGVCGDDESKAITLEPRNCLDSSMQMQAVKLVSRATCEVEGKIIDGMEVCGNLTSTNLNVYLQVDDDAWEEVSSLVTDEQGYASFIPGEAGEYKVAYSSDRDIYTLFEIKQCLQEEKDPSTPSKNTGSSGGNKQEVTPPVVEEPTTIDESALRWTTFSLLMYFIVAPILLIALALSSVGFAYKYEKKKKKENGFTKTIDMWIKQIDEYKKKVDEWIEKTPAAKKAVKDFKAMRKKVRKEAVFIKDLLVDTYVRAIIAIGLVRKVEVEFASKESLGGVFHLVAYVIIRKLFPKKEKNTVLANVIQYKLESLLDVVAVLKSYHANATYVDPQPTNITYLNALLKKGVKYRSRAPGRVDIESALQEGRPVVAIINELGDNNTIIQALSVVIGFDKQSFYYHDFGKNRKSVKVEKNQFLHAWKAAGYKGIILRK